MSPADPGLVLVRPHRACGKTPSSCARTGSEREPQAARSGSYSIFAIVQIAYMRSAASLLRTARVEAGLSQASLASQVGMPQSVVARLERPGSNPTWETMARALSATGHELQLRRRRAAPSSLDETQVAERLRIPAGERIKSFERSYANVRELALAAARGRGELA